MYNSIYCINYKSNGKTKYYQNFFYIIEIKYGIWHIKKTIVNIFPSSMSD